MLDTILILIVAGLTAVTLVYGRGCEALLESDSTRDASVDLQ